MLLRLLQGNIDRYAIIQLLLSIPVILFSLTVHECAHGLVASWFGDPTAKNLGRLTLNPAKHLDPVGTILMLVCGFGWAKPVPINTRYFKKPREGMCVTALAGPISNILLSFVSFMIYYVMFTKILINMEPIGWFYWFIYIICYLFDIMAIMNLSLAVFNLLPIPPLDGSRILFVLLPTKIYFKIMQYDQYISIALMILIVMGAFSGVISTVSLFILNLFEKFAMLIFG